MLSTEPTAPKSFELFLQKTRQLDLSPIAYQLMKSRSGAVWTKAQTVKAIAQYLAFLYLTDCYPDRQLVPSVEVDRVWHCHILDTSKYAEDCQFLFGYMIHHFPYLGLRGRKDQQNHRQAYLQTQALFNRHFDFTGQTMPPGDCEPIRQDRQAQISSAAGCAHHLRLQSRPQVAVHVELLHELGGFLKLERL